MNQLTLILALGLVAVSCKHNFSHEWDIAPQEKKTPTVEAKAGKRPNIIIIVADDLGKAEVSAYGSDRVATPNIDQIGKDGITFHNAYVTSPICAPSRAAILTGKYQQRYGFETQPMEYYPKSRWKYKMALKAKRLGDWNVKTPPSYPYEDMLEKQGIPLSEVTLPEVYQKAGYTTAMVGKWHLGYGPEYTPNSRGFDYHYGFLGAFSIYTPKKRTKGYHSFVQDDFSSKHQWKMARKENATILENGNEVIEEEYLTFAFAKKANRFISKQKDSSFFLMVNFNAPHVPFQAPDEYYDMYAHIEDENKRVYYAMIKALDDGVGMIMNHLEKEELLENTIVYFISDNGGASYTKATDNGELKGGKLTLFEGGIQVPFMMQWKGQIEPGQHYNKMVSSMDIFPTSVNASNLSTDVASLDGIDLIPFFKDPEQDPHEKLYWRSTHVRAIRYKKWKLILSTRDNWLHLYNIENDKSEKVDLSDLNKVERENLLEFFEAWNSTLPTKPLWPRIMDRKFIIGDKVYYFPA